MREMWNPGETSTELDDDFHYLDHIPLATRRRLLLSARQSRTTLDELRRTRKTSPASPSTTILPSVDIVVKKEEDICVEEGISTFSYALSVRSGAAQQIKQEGENSIVSEDATCEVLDYKRPIDTTGSAHDQDVRGARIFKSQRRCISRCSQQIASSEGKHDGSGFEKVDGNAQTSSQYQVLADAECIVKANCLGDQQNESTVTDFETAKVRCNASTAFSVDLDPIGQKEKQMVLLKRNQLILENRNIEGSSAVSSVVLAGPCAGRVKEETGIHERKACAGISSGEALDSLPVPMSSMQSSTLQTSVKVKAEPFDGNDKQNINETSLGYLSFNIALVKRELESPRDEDRLDHMTLSERMKLQKSHGDSVGNISKTTECIRKFEPSTQKFRPIISETPRPIKVNHSRKRKKTATDSIEAALEEDAPGLLKVLVQQGVSVDEIKLYGGIGDDELDDSDLEETFSDLEAVMSKLFFQQSHYIKVASVHGDAKGVKPSYCLACLFSLVEQTRYLQFRSWPVEWGWCRDLQSFVFVFERHKRIVLERPEYGYATYFFEVADSSTITWQVKRLVTAMKLTNCGRISLIENKTLRVGEDLSEGEANVLRQYGWIPNTGLGTMLNYCDRVVHDRRNDRLTSEWRTKIANMLMDGYNGGSLVSTTLLKGEETDTKIKVPKLET